jgi:hypothetical protein
MLISGIMKKERGKTGKCQKARRDEPEKRNPVRPGSADGAVIGWVTSRALSKLEIREEPSEPGRPTWHLEARE